MVITGLCCTASAMIKKKVYVQHRRTHIHLCVGLIGRTLNEDYRGTCINRVNFYVLKKYFSKLLLPTETNFREYKVLSMQFQIN